MILETAALPLLGRERERAVVDDLVDGIAERGGALVVRGEAGIGKSALLREASERARARGVHVLTTTGVQSEAHLPFAGLHQLLRPCLAEIGELPAPQRSAVSAAFGMTDVAAPDMFLIALASLELLGETAAHSPLMLVVEDAQWLDRPTADVLAFVARRLESEPIVLRDGSDNPLETAGLPELGLEALDESAAGALLDLHAPDLALPVRSRLLAASAGNPLALLELPAALGSELLEGATSLPERLPLTAKLERAFAARVSELPQVTQTLLLVAAADESGVLQEVLTAASTIEGAAVSMDALQPAISARLIEVDEPDLRFRHPLVRSAIYASASVPERHAAHTALADALVGEPDRRAWHRAASCVGPDADVAAELEAVAARAQRRGGIVVAVAAFERAAKLSENPLDQGRRLLQAAGLAFELGRPTIAIRLLEEAEPLELRPLERARMTWIREMLSPGGLGDAARVRRLVDLAEQANADGDRNLALDLLWLVAARCWWADPGTDARERVVAAAERLGAVDEDLRLLAIVAYAAPVERGRIVIDRLTSSSAMETDGDIEANRLLGSAAIVVGAFDLSGEFIAAAVAARRAQGRLGHLARLLVFQAWAATHVGNWNVAVPAIEEAGRLAAETGQPVWVAGARVVKAMLVGMRGQDELAQELAADAEGIALPVGASFILAVAQLARGGSALAAGRHEEAYEHLIRMLDPADSSYHPFICTWAIADLAEAATHSGHEEPARQIVGELEAVAARTPSPWLQLGMRYARAVLAEDEHAERLFQTALDADLGHWPFHRARLLLAYGAWLRRHRRVAESRAPLRAAREAFDALGVSPWGERARQELRASGETSRHRTPEARDELSPQELQIAQMAAGGLTNREIGQRLYLSHRTVGSHLYRIFPKLGITSRAHLSAALQGDIAA